MLRSITFSLSSLSFETSIFTLPYNMTYIMDVCFLLHVGLTTPKKDDESKQETRFKMGVDVLEYCKI